MLLEKVTLSLLLQAYPEPSPENITWVKCEKQFCEKLKSNYNINITTKGLHTELQIQILQNSDYGQYIAKATNGVGMEMEQEFYIYSQGKAWSF